MRIATYACVVLGFGVVCVFITLVISIFAARARPERHCVQAGGDGQNGLEENGRRSRRHRRPIGAAVAARVSDERSEESARQDERQPASRSLRSAARLVTTGLFVGASAANKLCSA